SMVQDELGAVWRPAYLDRSVERKTVVDIGAGCGETARFYLLHGAKSVLAVESSLECYRNLVGNFRGDGRVIPVRMEIGHIKVDIEGAEEGMLVETHRKGLEWRVVNKVNQEVWA